MFIEIAATKRSITKRSPILGVGINDANYLTSYAINGHKFRCPYYKRWRSMIERCYSKKLQARKPTYRGCSVCPKWFIFSNFKSWMEKQDWENKSLDKDILNKGNKVYSPSTCIFVTQAINVLMCEVSATRGRYPQGVILRKDCNKFMARCNVNNKQKSLGLFDTAEEASEIYQKFKSELILSIAKNQSEPLRSALISHVKC